MAQRAQEKITNGAASRIVLSEEFAADGKDARLLQNYPPHYTIPMHPKPCSNNLREFRTKAGLRQIDVARLLELDCADRLSRWENGSAMPNVMNLFKLSALYKAAPQELYFDLYRSIANSMKGSSLNPSTAEDRLVNTNRPIGVAPPAATSKRIEGGSA